MVPEADPNTEPPSQPPKVGVGDISDIKDSEIDVAGGDIRKTKLKSGATYIEKVEIITSGISSFSEILRQPDMREALQQPAVLRSTIGYKTDFRKIAQQLRELNNLKRLHDAFHKMEWDYDQVSEYYKGLPGNTRAWERIVKHKHSLVAKIQGLLHIAREVSFSEDVLMVNQLKQIMNEMEAVFESDPQANSKVAMEHLDASIYTLRRVLTSHPKTIDARLYDIVRSLQLDKIVDGMVNIQNLSGAKGQNPEAGTYFQQSLSEINQLAQELENLSEFHNKLQSIAHELYRIEANLTLRELSLSWRYLDSVNSSLEAYPSVEWLDSLLETKVQLTQSLASKLEWEVKDHFWAYKSQITVHFQDTDSELLSMTNELGIIGRALEGLLEFLEELT